MSHYAKTVTREFTQYQTRDLAPQVKMLMEILPQVSEDAACEALITVGEDMEEAMDFLLNKVPEREKQQQKQAEAEKEQQVQVAEVQSPKSGGNKNRSVKPSPAAAAVPAAQVLPAPCESREAKDSSDVGAGGGQGDDYQPAQSEVSQQVSEKPEEISNVCPFEADEPPVPEFPEPCMEIPALDYFKVQARKDVAPTRAEKDCMKLRKKLNEIAAIEGKISRGEKVDALQLPKIEKKGELEDELHASQEQVDKNLETDAEALRAQFEKEEEKRVDEEKKALVLKIRRLEQERLERIEQKKRDHERRLEEERLQREEEERLRKQRIEEERQRKIKEEEDRKRREEEERQRRLLLQQQYNYTNNRDDSNHSAGGGAANFSRGPAPGNSSGYGGPATRTAPGGKGDAGRWGHSYNKSGGNTNYSGNNYSGTPQQGANFQRSQDGNQRSYGNQAGPANAGAQAASDNSNYQKPPQQAAPQQQYGQANSRYGQTPESNNNQYQQNGNSGQNQYAGAQNNGGDLHQQRQYPPNYQMPQAAQGEQSAQQKSPRDEVKHSARSDERNGDSVEDDWGMSVSAAVSGSVADSRERLNQQQGEKVAPQQTQQGPGNVQQSAPINNNGPVNTNNNGNMKGNWGGKKPYENGPGSNDAPNNWRDGQQHHQSNGGGNFGKSRGGKGGSKGSFNKGKKGGNKGNKYGNNNYGSSQQSEMGAY